LAANYARQGIEIARSIRAQGWTTPFLATDCSLGCGATQSNNQWAWSGSSITNGNFSVSIFVNDVQRDANNLIVQSNGTNDPDSKKITARVQWTSTLGNRKSLTTSTYLTNWKKSIPAGSCNEYCISVNYAGGTCRQNIVQCQQNNETNEVAGNTYCLVPNGDTCCCSGSINQPSPTPTPNSDQCNLICSQNGYSSGICRQNTQQCENNNETPYPVYGYCSDRPNVDICCCK
jgi:hypothetical protein